MDGEIPLILLPGIDGVGASFLPLIEHLGSSVQPIVIAYPCDRVMGYEGLFPMVMGKLPDSPFILLGESFSSPLSIMIAAARPRGLKGLILCSAFARNPLWLSPNWLAYLTHPFFFRVYAPRIRYKVWRLGGRPGDEARLAALCSLTHDVIANRAREALRVNVLEQLAGLKIPVMYVRGERDLLIHSRNLSEMSRALPSMRVARLEGGHCVLKSRPALAAPAILDFIANCHKHTEKIAV
jgi:pimeloyl-ACP methyl ester carboxylesterase